MYFIDLLDYKTIIFYSEIIQHNHYFTYFGTTSTFLCQFFYLRVLMTLTSTSVFLLYCCVEVLLITPSTNNDRLRHKWEINRSE